MRPPLVPPFLHVLPSVYLARHMLSTTKTKESRRSPVLGGLAVLGAALPLGLRGPAPPCFYSWKWLPAASFSPGQPSAMSGLLCGQCLLPFQVSACPSLPLGTFCVWPGHRIPQSRVLSQTRSPCPPRNREIEPSPVSEGKPSRACSSTQIKCLPLPRACGALPSAPVSHFPASLPRPAPASFPASTPPAPPTSVLWACKKFSLQIVRKLCLPAPHHSDKSWTVPSS